jgi:drug/metabolite transporter (DMT)-like permease
MQTHATGTAYALAAAILFGITAPFAKRFLTGIPAIEASGLLYTSAGLVLAICMLIQGGAAEARLRRADVPYLAGAIFFGGLLGPCLLLLGLAHATGTVASLLLNLEAVFTVLIALALGESLDRRAGFGILAILAGSVLVAVDPGAVGSASLLGVAAVAGACLSWGIDNNVTQKLAGRDPLAIVAVKGLVAGPIALGLAALTGAPWPSGQAVLAGLVLGASGYGLSLVCFVRALRDAGTARTGSLFATAPFVGAVCSLVVLREPLGWQAAGAGALMALGVVLMLGERHEHAHTHEALEHDHVHVHDEHHQHAHDGTEGPEPHSHPHLHEPLTHTHPHAPDLHHRHKH